MGGADSVAVGDRGQALDVGAEQPLEGPGLGLAQLGELGGDVRHRAVVLADLQTGGDPGRRARGMRRPRCARCWRRSPGRSARRPARAASRDPRPSALLEGRRRGARRTRPRPRRRRSRAGSAARCWRGRRRRAGRRRARRRSARTSAPGGRGRRCRPRLDARPATPRRTRASRWRRTAGGGQAQPLGERGRALRTVLEHQPRDGVAGAVGAGGVAPSGPVDFHNTSMTYMADAPQPGRRVAGQ